jgi:hypothetical protein
MARQTLIAQGLFHIYSIVLAPKIVPKKSKLYPANATLPPPRFIKVQDHGNSRNCWKFFDYWRSLAGWTGDPTEKAELVEVRFYMHWPVVSLKLVEPNRSDTVFKMFTGPMWFENPEDYVLECQQQLGSGGWHVVLNEANVHGALCEAYFSAINLDTYPPKIDLRTLVRGDTKNADYLRWLGVQGIETPWDNLENEDDMQTGDVLKVVVDGMRETNQLVREKTEELAEAKLAAVEEQLERTREEQSEKVEKRVSAENEAVKLVTDSARELIGMAREDRKQHDSPIEIIKTVVELVRPNSDIKGTEMFISAMKDQNAKMLEMQNSNQEFMRSVMGMRKNQDGTWAPPEQPQQKSGGFEEEMTRFQRLADLLGWQKPGAVIVRNHPEPEAPAREPEKGFWSAVAENPVPVITGITTVVTLIANLIYNLRSEPGKATSPAEALQKVNSQPNPVQQQPQYVDPKDPRAWMPFAKHLFESGCLRAHFWGADQQMNGYTFAEFILSNFTGGGTNEQGRKNYASILENLQRKGFDAMIRAYPQLWDIVKDTPQQYETFLDEFFGYDEMVRAQEGAAA